MVAIRLVVHVIAIIVIRVPWVCVIVLVHCSMSHTTAKTIYVYIYIYIYIYKLYRRRVSVCEHALCRIPRLTHAVWAQIDEWVRTCTALERICTDCLSLALHSFVPAVHLARSRTRLNLHLHLDMSLLSPSQALQVKCASVLRLCA